MRLVRVNLQPWPRFCAVVVLLAGVLGVGGCAKPQNGTVTGKVTLNGKPLPDVLVLFVPPSGPAAGGVTNDDGVYELTSRKVGDGVNIGQCKVCIYPSDMLKPTHPVPVKYHDPESSGLNAQVEDGANVVNFELTGK